MKLRSGFTLLELILFMSIAGITMAVIVFFLVQINRLSVSNDVAATVDQEGLRIQENITREIAGSIQILDPDLGDSPETSLTLLQSGGLQKTIALDGENLVVTSAGTSTQLNPETTNITNLSFEQINTESESSATLSNKNQTVQAVRVSFQLNYDAPNITVDSPEYDYSRTFAFSAYQDKTIPRLTVTDQLDIWLKAGEGVTYDGSNVVSEWVDQSGNAVSFTPPSPSGTTSPTFQTNVQNGYPAIRFDGDDYLSLNSAYTPPVGDSSRTVIAVVDNITQTGANYNHILHYGTNQASPLNQAYGLLSRTNEQNVIGNHYWANNYTSSIPFPIQDGAGSSIPQIVMNSYDGTSDWIFLQEDQFEINDITLNTVANEFLIGSRIGGAAEFFQGDLLELLFYSKALDAEEREEVYNYLQQKYNVYKELRD